jgi:hypothetical protein
LLVDIRGIDTDVAELEAGALRGHWMLSLWRRVG